MIDRLKLFRSVEISVLHSKREMVGNGGVVVKSGGGEVVIACDGLVGRWWLKMAW